MRGSKTLLLVAAMLLLFGCAEKSQLIQASAKGDPAEIQKLVNQGANVNEADAKGVTPLMYAAMSGKTEAAELLWNLGANLNAQDKYGYSALIHSLSYGYEDMSQLLIECNADVNARTYNGDTPLLIALAKCKTPTIKMLINNGADINARNNQGDNAILYAAGKGTDRWFYEVVEMLIDEKADVNSKNSSGETPLLIAAYQCNLDLVRLLVGSGADIALGNSRNVTPIHQAAQCSGPEGYSAVKFLMEKGADLTKKDDYGMTPLNHALYYKNIDNAVLIRTKYHDNWDTERASVDDALRSPSRVKPAKDAYLVTAGKETDYGNAVIDCNYMVVPYKTGLLFITGPAGYGVGLAIDSVMVKSRFQNCMEKMGFQCLKDCSK